MGLNLPFVFGFVLSLCECLDEYVMYRLFMTACMTIE